MIVSSEGEEEVFSWPHEMVKEFHAAKAVRGTEIIYYIASKPELNVVTKFLASMLVETDIESAKHLLVAMFLLQSDQPICASSKLKKLFGHCCSKIAKLKHNITNLEIDELLGIGDRTHQKLKSLLKVSKIQKCLRKTNWFIENLEKIDLVRDCIGECTSQDTRVELCRAVFHPFLPSVASGNSALKVFDTEGWKHQAKGLKVYIHPASDDGGQMMFTALFKMVKMKGNGKVRDEQKAGVDIALLGCEHDESDEINEGDEDLEGFHLFVLVDQTLKWNQLTKDSLHRLAKRVKHINHLILDVSGDEADATWCRESVTTIQHIFKPKGGLVLSKDAGGLFRDEDLHALKQIGVQFADADWLGATSKFITSGRSQEAAEFDSYV